MKVLILGAKGQLGRAVIDQCQVAHISFTAYGRADLDITHLEALKKIIGKNKFTHIINCAAYTNVDLAETEAHQAYECNAQGPENIGKVAKEEGLFVVHVSTDYIFDGKKKAPYKEEDRANPLNVYGKSKWEGELRLLEQLPSACIVRTSWVFGHYGKNFISAVMHMLKSHTQIKAIEDQVNRATYNRDLAQALIDLSCHSGIFHFANETPLTRYQIVQDFYRMAKENKVPILCEEIVPVSASAFASLSLRPKNTVLCTEKVTSVLGRKPRLWETVLKEYFDVAAHP